MAGNRRSVCALFQVKVHARLSTKQKENQRIAVCISNKTHSLQTHRLNKEYVNVTKIISDSTNVQTEPNLKIILIVYEEEKLIRAGGEKIRRVSDTSQSRFVPRCIN